MVSRKLLGGLGSHVVPDLGLGLVLDTHCGDSSIHLHTIYISTLYQAEGFLSVLSAFWREGRAGDR